MSGRHRTETLTGHLRLVATGYVREINIVRCALMGLLVSMALVASISVAYIAFDQGQLPPPRAEFTLSPVSENPTGPSSGPVAEPDR